MTTPQFEVRWVYQQVPSKRDGGLKIEAGQKPALCFRGRKYALCLAAGYPVRVLKRPVADYDRYRRVYDAPAFNGPVAKGAQPPGQRPYSIEHAVESFRRIAEKNGITAGAARLLERAASQQNGVNEDEFQDEEQMEMSETKETGVTNATPATPAKETPVTAKSKRSKKTPKAKATKKAGKAKGPRGPSRISQAVEYMRAEIKKAGGQKKLERGYRKELFERAAKKFDLSPITCSIQYNRQILNG